MLTRFNWCISVALRIGAQLVVSTRQKAIWQRRDRGFHRVLLAESRHKRQLLRQMEQGFCGIVRARSGVYSPRLSLPNMLSAAARYGFGRLMLGQLLFADGARFSHHVRHGLTPRLDHSMVGAGYKCIVSSGM